MRWLNYHHLYHFFRVARAGSIAAAARELRLTHSTLSVQIRELGQTLGGALFERRGRRLVLTPRGEQVLAYAEEIFQLGAELLDAAPSEAGRPAPVRVGLAPGVPRSLALGWLLPALHADAPRLSVHVDGHAELLEALGLGTLHLLITDVPGASWRGRTTTHLLGRSGVGLHATEALAAAHRGGFPQSLHGAPVVLPSAGTAFRRLVDRWLEARSIRPKVVAETDDAATLHALGSRGAGLFPLRLTQRAELERALGVELVGTLDGVEEAYFAVTLERRVQHPFVSAVMAGDATREHDDGARPAPSPSRRRGR